MEQKKIIIEEIKGGSGNIHMFCDRPLMRAMRLAGKRYMSHRMMTESYDPAWKKRAFKRIMLSNFLYVEEDDKWDFVQEPPNCFWMPEQYDIFDPTVFRCDDNPEQDQNEIALCQEKLDDYLNFIVPQVECWLQYSDRLAMVRYLLDEPIAVMIMLCYDHHLVLSTKDEDGNYIPKDIDLLTKIYRLRHLLGMHQCFHYSKFTGEKDFQRVYQDSHILCEPTESQCLDDDLVEGHGILEPDFDRSFKMQADDSDEDQAGEALSIFDAMIVPDFTGIDDALETGIIRRAVDKFISIFTCGFSTAYNWIKSSIKSVVDYIQSMYKSLCDAVGFLSKKLKKVIIFCVIAGMLLVAGFIGYKVLASIFKFMSGTSQVHTNVNISLGNSSGEKKFEMQGDTSMSEVGLLVAAVSFAFGGLGLVQTADITKTMQKYVKIAAGGALMAATGRVLFFCLPKVITEFFIYKVAPESVKKSHMYAKWVDEATMLIKCGMVPSVLCSKQYFEKLKDCEKVGEEFLKNSNSPETRTQIINIYSQVLKLYTEVYPFHVKVGSRRVPYAIHVAGIPGVGKSLLQSDIQKCLGYRDDEVYNRQAGQQFWSGYNQNHKMVVFDEFLATADGELSAADILSLVSPAVFKPDMASLNSPFVGVKGTVAEPTFVMTINNHLYKTVIGVSKDALHRRRNMNVYFDLNASGRRFMKDGRLDIAAMPEEYLASKGWITVKKFPALEATGSSQSPIQTWTFTEFLVELKKDYEAHHAICTLINEGRGETGEDSPEVIMDRVLAKESMSESFDFSISGATSLVKGFFNIQGRSKKKKELEVPDGEKFVPMSQTPDMEVIDSIEFGFVPPEVSEPESSDVTDTDESVIFDSAASESDCVFEDTLIQLRPNGCTEIIAASKSSRTTNLLQKWNFRDTEGIDKKDLLHWAAERILFENFRADVDGLGKYRMCKCGVVLAVTNYDQVVCENCQFDIGGVTLLDRVMNLERLNGKVLSRVQTVRYVKNNGVNLERISEFLARDDVRDSVVYNTKSLTTTYMEWFKKQFGPMIKMFAALTAIGLVCYFMKRMLGKVSDPEEEDRFYQMGSNTKRSKDVSHKSRNYQTRRYDQQGKDLSGNVYKISAKGAANTKRMHAIGLVDKKILTNHHFFIQEGKLIPKGTILTIEKDGKDYECKFNPFFLVADESADLAVYDMLESAVPSFKDCRKNFVTDREFEKFNSASCCLAGLGEKAYTRASIYRNIKYGDKFSTYRHDLCVIYNISTAEGDCGRPLTVISGDLSGKIIGLHVGHADGTGVAAIVTSSFFEKAFDMPKDSMLNVLGEISMQGAMDDYTEEERKEITAQTDLHKDYICNVWGYVKHHLRTNLRRWTMINHDISKYGEEEMPGYIDKFIRKVDSPNWERALAHHYRVNAHHPQHWLDTDGTQVYMPLMSLEESVIDMMASRWQKQLGEKVRIRDLADIAECFLDRYTDENARSVRTILRRMIEDETEVTFCKGLFTAWANHKPAHLMDLLELPNCEDIEYVENEDLVHIPIRSKIIESSIKLSHTTERFFPILSRDDPRSYGKDPIEEGVKRILSAKVEPIPDEEGRVVYEQMKAYYDQKFENAKFKTGIWRRLTLAEAVRGIPGHLKSINLTTSTGWPHVKRKKKPGKHDFLNVIEGEICWNAEFEFLVAQKLMEVNSGVSASEHLWLGFLKDELVSKNKIDDVRTRIVYCGDVICNVVNRILFGSLLVNYNALEFSTPITSSMNQYSCDMDAVKEYLDEVDSLGYIAGDARNFDINYNPTAQKYVYKILSEMAKTIPEVEPRHVDFCLDKEMNSRVQIGHFRFKPKCLHSSGCFFTSSVNSLIHEFYWRVVFNRKFPDLQFEEEVRAKFCGDDNIVRPSTKIWDRYNAVEYAKEAATFGQAYTSDVKGAPLEAEPREFCDITFLGAHPRLTSTGLGESWTGALKQNTILDALVYKKSRGYSETDVSLQMVEMASQWDKEFYEKTRDEVAEALRKAGETVPFFRDYETCHRNVKARSGRDGGDYSMFFDMQSQDVLDYLNHPGLYHQVDYMRQDIEMKNFLGEQETDLDTCDPRLPERFGVRTFQMQSDDRNLTSLKTEEPEAVAETPIGGGDPDKGFQDSPMSLQFTQFSNVIRHQYSWNEGDKAGHIVAAIPIPFGLLSLGNQKSMQNRPFEQFQYWKGDTKLTVQVNGNKFQQGMLAVYFIPLWTDPTQARSHSQIPSFNPVYIQPSSTRDTEITIPFRYYRNMLNTRAAGETDESLGMLFITVFSMLLNLSNSDLTVTVLSAFPTSEFRIPGVIKTGSNFQALGDGERAENDKDRYYLEEGVFRVSRDSDEYGIFNIQGNTTSNSSVSYNVGEVGGTMAVENAGPSTKGGVKSKVKADVTVMDNPMLSSGGVPTFPQFSGMSVVEGIEPTTSLQMHPKGLTRTLPYHFGSDDGEQTFESLCRRDCIVSRIEWSSSNAAKDNLMVKSVHLPLCAPISGNGFMEKEHEPSIADFIADHFTFWRADFVFTVLVVKTMFHTGRLQISMSYGANRRATFAESTNSYSEIIDFRENETVKFVIPYNAPTEFLNCYEPCPEAEDPFQDYSLGIVQLDVLNRLAHPDTVEDRVEVIVMAHLENVKFHCPRKYGVVGVGPPVGRFPLVPGKKDDDEKDEVFEMQAADETEGDAMPVDGNVSEIPEEVIGDRDSSIVNPPCTLKVADHFEYCPSSVAEFMRRPKQTTNTYTMCTGKKEESLNDFRTPGGIQFEVCGLTGMPQLFAGVRGGQKLRIYTASKYPQTLIYVPDGRNNRFYHPPEVTLSKFTHGKKVDSHLTDKMRDYRCSEALVGSEKFFTLSQDGGNIFCDRHNFDSNEAVRVKDDFYDQSYQTAFDNDRLEDVGKGSFAQEMLIPVGDANYIDVYVPYQNIKNFLRTSEQIWGTVCIMKGDSDVFDQNRIFASAADDMQFGLYHGLSLLNIDYGVSTSRKQGVSAFGFSRFQTLASEYSGNQIFRLGGVIGGAPDVKLRS